MNGPASTIQISFCIPTYNFGRFIGQTLDSILAQADERVQIVIVDGGSKDQTADVVAAAAARFPGIKFLPQRHAGGVDAAILQAVADADGPYAWLFSSDDVLAPGALTRVRAAIDAGGWDLMLTGATQCDAELRPLWRHRVLAARVPSTWDWSDPAARADYFRRARTTTAFGSFIGAVVVRRQAWLAAGPVDRYVGSCWIIAAKLYAMSRAGLAVRFDPEPLVRIRGENDSFAGRGLVWRTGLSLRGFRQVAWDFFGPDSMEARHISRVLRHEYRFLPLLHRKLLTARRGDPRQVAELEELVRLHYDRRACADRLRVFLYRHTPLWLLAALEAAYRAARPVCRRLGR
jgi:abequosyltransferase